MAFVQYMQKYGKVSTIPADALDRNTNWWYSWYEIRVKYSEIELRTGGAPGRTF